MEEKEKYEIDGDRMCKLCAAREKNPTGSMWLENTIIEAEFCRDEVYLYADRDYPKPGQLSIQIKYCPFCGRKF